jgi:carboxyl-terminal processing protease
MTYLRARRSLAIAAAAAVLAAPLGLAGGLSSGAELQPAGKTVATAGSALPMQAWEVASRGDTNALIEILTAEGNPRHAEIAALLKTNFVASEQRREEETGKVRERLTRVLEEESDLALADALKAAVELSMLSPNKQAVLEEVEIRDLVRRAESAAEKAAERGDWLTASDLYFRLNLLFEERNPRYKANFKRENQRLGMIRIYAPERLWELRNDRRNAELKRQAKIRASLPDTEEAEEGTAKPDEEARPLPPYNPTGDNFREKLAGIEENMVLSSIGRAFERHVEKRSMDLILRNAIKSVRTLVTTPDLEPVFPGIADEESLRAFVSFLASEDERLERVGQRASRADMLSVLDRLVAKNEQTVHVPKIALLHEFGNGAMDALDEFSAIVWPDEIRRFNRNTQGRFIGVGIQIELDPLSNIRVVTPLEGTPAQRAGVRPGDLIKKVNGTSTIGFTLDQAVDVITGPENTEVVLTLERENEEGLSSELDMPLRRAIIPIYTVKGWKRLGPREDEWEWFIDRDSRIGYVRLTGFNERSDAEFDRAINQMKDLNGLILDLRHNPGGLLEQAVEITSRFVDRNKVRNYGGMVVTTHDKDNRLTQQERALSGKARLAGVPVVVLINEGSASASEIVSGALQDYARTGDAKAIVLGSRSYGKGSVQNVWPFERPVPAAVKVTTQYYRLPSGRQIHRTEGAPTWGVEPDMIVDMLPGQIVEAFQFRQAADVLKLDENGQPTADARESDPEDLIRKGIDLQLHQALVILQSQSTIVADGPALVDRPAAP